MTAGPSSGWQRQDNGPSVQAALEQALFKLTGEVSTVTGAGRTDAGVHAMAQVAHFDLAKDFAPEKIRDGLNHFLRPDPVAVIDAAHRGARFPRPFLGHRAAIISIASSRAARRWRSTAAAPGMWCMRSMPKPCTRPRRRSSAITTSPPSAPSECQAKSPVKTLDTLDVRRAGDEIHIDARARSFLHNQVRSMVGSLKLVGEGKWSAADLKAALEAKDRAACGPVAPPEGLYLAGVDYPEREP